MGGTGAKGRFRISRARVYAVLIQGAKKFPVTPSRARVSAHKLMMWWTLFQNSKVKFVNMLAQWCRKCRRTSVQEVENLIAELQILRGKLQNEAARVQREIRDYAVLIQGAKKSITTISGSLSFWKDRDAPKISA